MTTYSNVYEGYLMDIRTDLALLAYEELPRTPYSGQMIRPQVLNKLGCPQPFPTGFL